VAGSNGYGGSLLLEWALGGSHALRTRFDFTRYSAKTATTLVLTSSTSTKTTATYNLESSGVGIDYLYYPAARQDGWHFDIGLEALRHSTDVRGTITFGGVTISTASFSGPNTASTRLGVDLGAGYTFGQRWNLGTRFNSVRDSGRTLDSFNLSLGYRW
jgi:hypothetical protein